MEVEDPDGVALGNVPDDEEAVETGRDEDAVGRRVPLDVPDAARVAVEVDEPLVEDGRAGTAADAAVGNVPELDGAVVRAGGDDVVVERVPLDVEDRARVAGDAADDEVHSAGLKRTKKKLNSSHL